jgi:4-aminobutyrate aminotransferase/(S)-3-amino-2-methylpropionate transaminase
MSTTPTSQPTIRLNTAIPGPRSLVLQQRREASLPRGIKSALPVFIEKAEGATLTDIDGNRFLDFAGGIGCQNAGHRPPEVVKALHAQVDRFLHTCFMVTPYEDFVKLAEELIRRAPGTFAKKAMLFSTGAEAVENAVKIARHFTKRQAVISFEDGFHGRSQLAMSLTGKVFPYKEGFGPFAPEIYRVPYADIAALESAFKRQIDPAAVAAVIFEPVLGEGGFVIPPKEWFGQVTALCRKHGILVIADEVQTGFCRTGPLFASQRFGLEPDLLVTAKSIAAGLPLSAVVGRTEVMDSPGPGGLGGTYAGNPLACAAALEVLKTIDTQDLAANAERIGTQFARITAGWPGKFPLIADIRGVGAMCAIELVRGGRAGTPGDAETRQVLAGCHRRGLLAISAGMHGNIVRLLVPLVATEAQIAEGLSVLEEALREVHPPR